MMPSTAPTVARYLSDLPPERREPISRQATKKKAAGKVQRRKKKAGAKPA